MTETRSDSAAPVWTPRYPALLALGLLTLWVLILCLPMFSGRFLVTEQSDQMFTGVPFRWFGAGEWQRTGQVPLWNPYMFGGLPFVGAMHGDIFYPTAWLRLILPIDTAMNLGFAIHFVMAGFFAYLFFRVLRISWTGALAGGMAYQLCGVVASLVSPGHDGKLFVSAWMPLILTSLVLGVRDRRVEGFGLLALTAGLGIISPHIQMMQYTLIVAGLFTLYLCFWSPERPELKWRFISMGLALAAVVLAFGIAMIQLYPFIQYMPYAARSAGAQGWEYATSYAIPPEHMLDFLIADFSGTLDAYWGSNFFKLHSEYVGAGVILLAAAGVALKDYRRLVWFFAGAGLLFLLVCLGANTPFYRVWYALVPGVKVTRAPGMAFFIPSFVAALFAALGVMRLERGEGKRALTIGLGAAGLLLLLGASGALGALAENRAVSIERRLQEQGRQAPVLAAAQRNDEAIRLGAVKAALFAAAVAGLGMAMLNRKLPPAAFAGGLVVLIGGELFLNAKRFWRYSPPANEIFADDPITQRVASTAPPYRLYQLGDARLQVYPTAFLMGKRIPEVIGHHGNELNAYDQLLGGKNEWRNLWDGTAEGLAQPPRNLFQLLAVRYILLPQPFQIAGYHEVQGTTMTSGGRAGVLLEADTAPAYARVVPAAAKLPSERIVSTLMDPRLDVNRLVLLDESAAVDVPRLSAMPEPSASRATVTAWEPGRMTIRLDPAPAAPSFVVVSENWYPEWRAQVDGRPATLLRGNYTFLTVPVAAGAREVTLSYARDVYNKGKVMTLLATFATLGLIAAPLGLRRRRAQVG
jgi:hypothetical protein